VPENAVVVVTVHNVYVGGTGTSGLFYVTLPTATSAGGKITPLNGSTLSCLEIGVAPTNTMVAGVRLLVEPVVVLGAPPPKYEWKFPIRNQPIYRGLRYYLQCGHYEAGKWGVSRGLEVVIQ